MSSGGLDTVLNILETRMEHPGTAKACLLLLKCLAGSDKLKGVLARGPGAKGRTLILEALRVHAEHAPVLAAALGCITALSLRHPDISVEFAEGDAVPLMAQAMRKHPEAAGVQRQASMAIRNMVVRNDPLKAQVRRWWVR